MIALPLESVISGSILAGSLATFATLASRRHLAAVIILYPRQIPDPPSPLLAIAVVITCPLFQGPRSLTSRIKLSQSPSFSLTCCTSVASHSASLIGTSPRLTPSFFSLSSQPCQMSVSNGFLKLYLFVFIPSSLPLLVREDAGHQSLLAAEVGLEPF